MVALLVEEGVEADHVALGVDGVVVDVLVNDALVDQRLVGVEVGAEDGHAEALADAAESGADAAGADDAGGLAVEGLADEAGEVEVVVADAVVALVDAAVGGKRESHGVLGDGLRRVGRDAGDLHADLLGVVDVDRVEAGAAHEDEPDAEAAEDLEGHRRDVGVDEGADGVVALGEGGRDGGQVRLHKLDLDIRVVDELLLEGLAIVALGAVEENLHSHFRSTL